ncbi:MAG: flagellar basal body-associated FliL family protein [Alphaproteobacteria bacterium]|nr:flagellar basal body-associated FliL family protein [Alphaproteobacteria bacterium]
MKKFLPIIIIVIAGALGGGGGFFLKQATAPSSTEEAAGEAPDEGHEKEDKKGKKKKKDKKSEHGAAADNDAAYLKFGRQFVVPVVKGGAPQVMMILEISIEVDPSQAGDIYAFEPKLRDAFLAELMRLGSVDILANIIESPEAMANTKSSLLNTARTILGDGAKDILILGIGIQEY